jgi:hypothetical protein
MIENIQMWSSETGFVDDLIEKYIPSYYAYYM